MPIIGLPVSVTKRCMNSDCLSLSKNYTLWQGCPKCNIFYFCELTSCTAKLVRHIKKCRCVVVNNSEDEIVEKNKVKTKKVKLPVI